MFEVRPNETGQLFKDMLHQLSLTFFFRREISTRRLFAEDSAASVCPRATQGRVSVVGGPRGEMSQNEVVSEGGSHICPESTRSHIVSIVSQIFIFYHRLKWGQPNVINHPERNTPVNLRKSKENMQQVDLPHVW